MSSTYSTRVYHRHDPPDPLDRWADGFHFATRADLQVHLLGLIDDETITHITLIEDADGNPNHRILNIRPELLRPKDLKLVQDCERQSWAKITTLLGDSKVELALRDKFG